ncbi:MAG: GNAT family N-acetyltransferase [Gammaproteobacteria bacterium]|nr:GNAT family N-acetyltransferase [Gammaproteobacteria bacterium]
MNNIRPFQEINAYRLKLRAITENDLEQLLFWRNSPEIRNNMLSQNIITLEEQKKWFQSIMNEHLDDFHFIVEYKESLVGYANYKPAKNIIHDSDSQGYEKGQTGLYIGEKKYRGTVLAYCLALALLDFVFLELNEKEIDAVVLEHNQAAIRFNEKLGYKMLSNEEGLTSMNLKRANYFEAKNELLKTIRV